MGVPVHKQVDGMNPRNRSNSTPGKAGLFGPHWVGVVFAGGFGGVWRSVTGAARRFGLGGARSGAGGAVLLLAVVVGAVLVPVAPVGADSSGGGGVVLPPAGFVESDCVGEVPVVVGSDAKAQSDIYSAVTLAGVVGTDCVILAGARDGAMPASQRARLDDADTGGFVVGGVAAVPDAKVAGRDVTRIAGADRWATAGQVGSHARRLGGGERRRARAGPLAGGAG